MIYVIAEKDDQSAVKIGFTETGARNHKDPALKRLSGLQVGTWRDMVLIGHCPGYRADEKHLHLKFRTHRIRGEWFRNEGAVSLWLDEIKLPAPLVCERRGRTRAAQQEPKASATKTTACATGVGKSVLDFIMEWREKNENSPYMMQIADATGIHINDVYSALRNLSDLGAVRFERKTHTYVPCRRSVTWGGRVVRLNDQDHPFNRASRGLLAGSTVDNDRTGRGPAEL